MKTAEDQVAKWMSAYADAVCAYGNLLDVTRKLAFAARTSGGVAGRDEGLCSACDEAERMIANPKFSLTEG